MNLIYLLSHALYDPAFFWACAEPLRKQLAALIDYMEGKGLSLQERVYYSKLLGFRLTLNGAVSTDDMPGVSIKPKEGAKQVMPTSMQFKTCVARMPTRMDVVEEDMEEMQVGYENVLHTCR